MCDWNLYKFQSNTYVSYHKHIVVVLKYNEMIKSTNNVSIVEIWNENNVEWLIY